MRRILATYKNHFRKPRFALMCLTLLLALVFSSSLPFFSIFDAAGSGHALADDDDDGDDGDDDGSAGNSGGGNGSIISGGGGSYKKPAVRKKSTLKRGTKRQVSRQRAQTQRQAPVVRQQLPQNAPREIVATGLSGTGLTNLEAQGYRVIQRDVVRALEVVMVRLSVPQTRTFNEARTDIANAGAETAADFNHFYRNQAGLSPDMKSKGAMNTGCEGGHCAAMQQISWPLQGNMPKACAAGAVIGMIDTGINLNHEAFAGQPVILLETAMPGMRKSSLQHGTAVAAIFVGGQNTRTPGITPEAELVAVDVFHRDGDDQRADVYSIVKALDLLDQNGVALINMSLAGPPNDVLKNMIGQLVAEKSIIVAAAGNEGPNAPPAYPAAYPAVVAVTAIDSNRRVYRRANQGDQIDFAAPGVNVWTAASVKGAKLNSGTSFAAPFVTASLAAAKTATPLASPDQMVAYLKSTAIDLGKTGYDPVFGNGLIQTKALCSCIEP